MLFENFQMNQAANQTKNGQIEAANFITDQ